MSDQHAMPEGGWPPMDESNDRTVVSGMCHWFTAPNDPSCSYVVSHTGLIVEVLTQTGPSHKRADGKITKWVISMVNGSMAHNPLGEFVCCVNFDEYIMDWFLLPYQTHKVVGIAYFDPATCTYTEQVQPYPHRAEAAATGN